MTEDKMTWKAFAVKRSRVARSDDGATRCDNRFERNARTPGEKRGARDRGGWMVATGAWYIAFRRTPGLSLATLSRPGVLAFLSPREALADRAF